VLLLFSAVAAGLIWVALVYTVVRRLHLASVFEREQSLQHQLQTASWSDKFVEALLERNPSSVVLLTQYVAIARGRQEWPEALRRAELFTKRAPKSTTAWMTLADALWTADRRDDSDALVRRLHRRRPFNVEVTLRWARLPRARSDWKEAARRFAAFRRRAPRREEGYTEGTDILLRLGRPADAASVLRKGLRKCPGSVQVWLSAASFEERDSDPEAAVQAWAAFRERFPHAEAGFVRGAAALAKAGRADESDQLLVAASGFFPGNAEIAGAIAASAERRGRAAA
jgi:predicted Zn-dependent protease